MKGWMDEASKYNYANPVFSGATDKEDRSFIIIVSISGEVNLPPVNGSLTRVMFTLFR